MDFKEQHLIQTQRGRALRPEKMTTHSELKKKRKRVTTAGKRATTAGQSGTTAGERGDPQLVSKSIPNRREHVDMDKISFQPKLRIQSQDDQS